MKYSLIRTIVIATFVAITVTLPLVPGTSSAITTSSGKTACGAVANSTETLSLHSTGNNVANLQTCLTYLGYSTRGIDGDFGPNTRDAVVAFQNAKNLGADGVVGPLTKEALAEGVRQQHYNDNDVLQPLPLRYTIKQNIHNL